MSAGRRETLPNYGLKFPDLPVRASSGGCQEGQATGTPRGSDSPPSSPPPPFRALSGLFWGCVTIGIHLQYACMWLGEGVGGKGEMNTG